MALVDFVRWDGPPNVFAYKYPETNLTCFTQLVVNESQAAVMFGKGKLLQVFGPGRHTLTTENIPLLKNYYGIPFGGNNPFTAEVWFVNKVQILDVKWGTATPFQIKDPEFNIIVPIRAHGQFGIQITDPQTFLVKLVGTMTQFNSENLTNYFKGLLMSLATTTIAKTIAIEKVPIMQISAHLYPISQALHNEMANQFSDYGISLINFFVNSISVPEDDASVANLKELLTKKASMDILGYTYQQERSFNVLELASKNEGVASTIMGAGMGLGMGFGVGGAVGGMMGGVKDAVMNSENTKPTNKSENPAPPPPAPAAETPAKEKPAVEILCEQCGKPIPASAKFCPHCGDLYNPCPQCGADIPVGAKTCSMCNHKLDIVCEKCGKKIPCDSKFCTECGVKISTGCCPKCGIELAEGANFCPNCGEKTV